MLFVESMFVGRGLVENILYRMLVRKVILLNFYDRKN